MRSFSFLVVGMALLIICFGMFVIFSPSQTSNGIQIKQELTQASLKVVEKPILISVAKSSENGLIASSKTNVNNSTHTTVNSKDSKRSKDQATQKSDLEFLLDYRTEQNALRKAAISLGKKRLKALIDNQALELISLFELSQDPYDGREYRWIDAKEYGFYLAEEKDEIWAHQAEAFLQTNLIAGQAFSFTVLRIDCRMSKCEIAGIVNSNENMSIQVTYSNLQNYFKSELSQNNGFNTLFSWPSRPAISTQGNAESYPLPFSVLLYRKTPFTSSN